MELKVDLIELEKEALKNNIPIMQKEGLAFMIEQLISSHASSLLEIGSAVGYSSLMLAKNVEGLNIETIELDDVRFKQAKENVTFYHMNSQITLYHDDALTFDVSCLKNAPYDCLFIDAAKAQYQKFFEKYITFLKDDGFVIVDNLDFHGMVFDIEHIKNRNTRQLCRKIKRFKEWMLNNEDYISTYYPIGDGIVLIRKKGFNETDGKSC